MELRAKERNANSWVEVTPPKNNAELGEWLSRHDGKDVVLMDTAGRKYFCGSQELVEAYRGKGLEANSFYPLAKHLWDQRLANADDGRALQNYCTPGDCWCSEKQPGGDFPAGCVRCRCENHHGE